MKVSKYIVTGMNMLTGEKDDTNWNGELAAACRNAKCECVTPSVTDQGVRSLEVDLKIVKCNKGLFSKVMNVADEKNFWVQLL